MGNDSGRWPSHEQLSNEGVQGGSINKCTTQEGVRKRRSHGSPGYGINAPLVKQQLVGSSKVGDAAEIEAEG